MNIKQNTSTKQNGFQVETELKYKKTKAQVPYPATSRNYFKGV